ncbi:hypothetical protein [Defluviimonas salinarum]|uniref:Uncharacterized protein n=1 Tax=Defluviimonas salinarum TaxID=2992147 RepID=A0ABT3J4A1_9RHOB|nr:hypothetical protein [Defluviimonas salinarum]MCW3782502.1 hypothetical protein [Defluviimonas salinarum]
MPETIACGLCGREHKPVFLGSTDQGDGCAAEVAEGRLFGHYGSAVADMTVLDFKGDVPADGTLVCDTCITEMLADGRLAEADGDRATQSDEALQSSLKEV